ncbi:MAG TPA: uroporphyrinogen decarboxylase [Rhodospirillaceae bacterium]|nr:uroporphyrinogen decarboxylase [Candidatus Neomarinimicrobiota bacterium]HCX13679.1 uroporphyrinogen decarboxylase [Rhodospirillaceae bacterium]|tara:strand:+ start:641 stop:1699 length:1059 start_codon:yes stop_codon:yes gene_type:complete
MAQPQAKVVETVSSPFISACRKQPVPHTPVWIMRQAGRYLPEYRKVREKVDFVTLTRTPELAAEVTLQPLRRYDFDASIIFSDIMTPLQGMGVELEFKPGPVVEEAIRSLKQVEALRPLVPEQDVPFVMESIRIVRSELPDNVPLIGFAGSPFTLFCYLVAGKPSKEFAEPRSFLHAEPATSALLLDRLADAMIVYLRAQAAAGAQALMLFESWGGLLGPQDYANYAMPPVRRIVEGLAGLDVPLIYFANQGGANLHVISGLDVDVVGLDWRVSIAEARGILGEGKAVQGNLDPALLFAPKDTLYQRINDVLVDAGTVPGHIFNLGHGIWPETPPDAVARLVDYVHERTSRC